MGEDLEEELRALAKRLEEAGGEIPMTEPAHMLRWEEDSPVITTCENHRDRALIALAFDVGRAVASSNRLPSEMFPTIHTGCKSRSPGRRVNAP